MPKHIWELSGRSGWESEWKTWVAVGISGGGAKRMMKWKYVLSDCIVCIALLNFQESKDAEGVYVCVENAANCVTDVLWWEQYSQS